MFKADISKGVLGDAMDCLAPSQLFTYVGDFFGAWTLTDTISTQDIVHETIDKVLRPEGLSVKKNVHAQIAEIQGIPINFPSATMRPKDKAIEKLFFLLFSIDIDNHKPYNTDNAYPP